MERSATGDTAGAAREWRANWGLVLAGTLAISFVAVPPTTLGVFMQPLSDAFSWSRPRISLALRCSRLSPPRWRRAVARSSSTRFLPSHPGSPVCGSAGDPVANGALCLPEGDCADDGRS